MNQRKNIKDAGILNKQHFWKNKLRKRNLFRKIANHFANRDLSI